MIFQTINPATQSLLAEYESLSPSALEKVITSAAAAQRSWNNEPLEKRLSVIQQVGELLRNKYKELAPFITQEMGKPLEQAEAEISKCATVCDFVVLNAHRAFGRFDVSTEFISSTVHHQALGLVLSIMPWNFPFWQFFRFAIPALAAGNGVLLKHAPNTWGCAQLIVDLCLEGGVPQGLVACTNIDVDLVESVIADRRVQAVTFTGSTRAGKIVAAQAGKYVKKSVLELGGSDPYIVLADADVARAAKTCADARCINSGQSCIAAKRFLVHKSIAPPFIEAFTNEMHSKTVGNPMLNPDIGPLARRDLFENYIATVVGAEKSGAVLSRRVNGDWRGVNKDSIGFFVEPVVLTNVLPGSVADTEEIFGPAAAVIVVDNEAEAISVANNSVFGLGAAIFSADIQKAQSIAHELECGTVFINGNVRSDARLPFGGVKESGYGRELGVQGMMEFVNVKAIVEM